MPCVETRRQRAARLAAARATPSTVPSLAEQPSDVLALVGAALADALRPVHLTALASTCGALHHALRPAVVELKETRGAVSALLRKCSNPRKVEYTIDQFAAGGIDVIYGGNKGLDASDARLMARWLLGCAHCSMNSLWAYDNPGLGDAGVSAIARAFRCRPQTTLKVQIGLPTRLHAVCMPMPMPMPMPTPLPMLTAHAHAHAPEHASAPAQCLSLTETSTGDAGLCALATAMEGGALPRLTHLYLNQNGIGDVGLRAFCAAIAKGTPLPPPPRPPPPPNAVV